MIGPKRQRPIAVQEGRIEFPFQRVSIAAVAERFGEVGIEPERMVEVLDRALVLAFQAAGVGSARGRSGEELKRPTRKMLGAAVNGGVSSGARGDQRTRHVCGALRERWLELTGIAGLIVYSSSTSSVAGLSSALQGGVAMFREIIEVVGPITLKALATAAGLVVFAPLLAAWIAPAFS